MSQINDSRFIGPSAVTADDIKLQNNQYLLARNFTDTADINLLKIDSSDRAVLRLWTFPSSDGTVGQVLSTDGSGGLTWASPSGIGPNTINDTHIRLQNNAYLRSRNADNSGDINILKVDTSNYINLGSGSQITANTSNLFLFDGVTCPLLTFANAAGTFSIALKAPNALAANATYNLPLTDGSNGHFLKTDGSGNLSWAAAGGGGASGFEQTFLLMGA